MRILRKITFVFFIIQSIALFAQQYSFVQYSVEDGLSQTQVYSICPDNDGNLWIATGGGVSKFNGNEFTNYSKENGLTDNKAVQVVNHKGFTWIATKHGITRIKDKQIFTINILEYSKGAAINTITFDQNGMLLLIIFSSFLMISNFTFFSFKFDSQPFLTKALKYIFFIISILLLIFLGIDSLYIIILIYILLSLLNYFIKKLILNNIKS